MQILLYVSIYTIPLALWGFYNLFKAVTTLIKIKGGYVESTVLMEGGQTRTVFKKPDSGSMSISKDKKFAFKDGIGYVWRKGFKPFTVVREKDLMQLNLLEDKKDDSAYGAKDKSNVVIRSYNEGYIEGFRKNKMINNLVMYTLIGLALVAILCVLTFNNTNSILGILRAG